MRFSARWSNGFWKVFDSVTFDDLTLHLTQKSAIEAAERANRLNGRVS